MDQTIQPQTCIAKPPRRGPEVKTYRSGRFVDINIVLKIKPANSIFPLCELDLYNENQLYNFRESRDEYIREMKDAGMVIHLPSPNELQLDIDYESQYNIYRKLIWILEREYGNCPTVVTVSKNGGLHIYITLPFEVNDYERIAYQAALGSDPVRELLSLVRLHEGIEHPTLLAELNYGGGENVE